MIRPGILIRGKITPTIDLKGKTNASIIREYPELENIEITPTVEDQIYTPTKYGFEEVKVKGVQAYIDEDIKPEYIKDGVDILGVIGNVIELQGEEKTISPSTTQQIIVPSDGKNGMTRLTVEAVDSSIDENIKSENIKVGVSILDVEGGYEGIDTSNATATADDILKGKTSYSQNEEITGTIETYDGTYEGNVGEENNARLEAIGTVFSVVSSLVKMELIDTSECKNFDYAFQNCNNLESIPQLDTSNATSMNQMFMYCYKLKTIPLLNTSKVKNMMSMFFNCRELIEIPQIDTSNLIYISNMFCGCRELIEIPQIDTSKCTDFSQLFNGCNKLKTIPLLDGEKVIRMGACFQSCYNLLNLGGIKNLGKAYTQETNNYSNYTLTLVHSTNLTHESLMNVINNLYDLNLTYDVANGGTLYRQSLVLGSTNLAKLTEEEIAIATNKGWNVS